MNQRLISLFENNQQITNLTLKILVTLMVACCAIIFMNLGTRVYPGWNGIYLPVFACLFSVEAMASRKKTDDFYLNQKVIYHGAEWIIFAILLKVTIYLTSSPGQLWIDLPRWQANFFTFFEGEYLPVLVGLFVIWLFCFGVADDLENLQTEKTDFQWELGKLENNRQLIRSQLIQKILSLGAVGVIGTLLNRINLPKIFNNSPATQVTIVPIAVFFLLALVFFSLTQFSLLRGRWYWSMTPISQNIGKAWIRYSLLFLLVITLIALILPTSYTYSFLQTLQVMLNFLVSIFYFLVSLILVAASWFLSLFGLRPTKPDNTTPPVSIPEIIPPVSSSDPLLWLELLKSIFFWVVFIGMIIFAFRHYFSQNPAFLIWLRHFPLFRGLIKWLREMLAWLSGTTRQISSVFNETVKRIFSFRNENLIQQTKQWIDFRRLTPRQQIIYYYNKVLENSARSGWKRPPYQTPSQFKDKLEEGIPEARQEVSGITSQFIEARYSQHSVSSEQTSTVQVFWRKIIRALRRKKISSH